MKQSNLIVMDIRLESDRLLLREWTSQDAVSLYRLNADPEVLKYTADKPFADIKDAQNFVQDYDQYTLYGYGRWAVISKESGQFLGWCGLRRLDETLVDLGYRFYRDQWGKGYATEAGRRCLEYGFEKLNLSMIIGRVVPENIASKNVLIKLGMEYWKIDLCDGINGVEYYRIINPNSKKINLPL